MATHEQKTLFAKQGPMKLLLNRLLVHRGFALVMLTALALVPSAVAQGRSQEVTSGNGHPATRSVPGKIYPATCGSSGLCFPTSANPSRAHLGNESLSRREPTVRQYNLGLAGRVGTVDSDLPTNLLQGNRTATMEKRATPMAAGHRELPPAPIPDRELPHRLPEFFEEDTAFSTQMRLSVADLWGGRLQLDAFYREISADSVFRGLPQSNGVWWATPGSLTLRPAASYGIHLSFRMSHLRARTLCRYLFEGGA